MKPIDHEIIWIKDVNGNEGKNLGSKIMFNGIKMCFTNIKQSTGSINVFMEHLTQEILKKKKTTNTNLWKLKIKEIEKRITRDIVMDLTED